MEHHPPKMAVRFLCFFLKEELQEEVLGDLEEQYFDRLKKYSPNRAALNYWFQVINYLRPFALKNIRSTPMFFVMFRHNFLISFRILIKNKTFSSINIGGLALGMTVSIFIGLWMFDEYSFNKNHEYYDRIVQVLRIDIDSEGKQVNSSMPNALRGELTETYSHFFDHIAMTFFRPQRQFLTYDQRSFNEMGYFFEGGAPHIFSLNMISGTRDALQNPSNIILSESMAAKLFGDEDAMGKTVRVNSGTDLIVQGIFEDLPSNSTFGDAQFFLPMSRIYNEENPAVWDNFNVKIFALMSENVSISDASAAIKDVIKQFRPADRFERELFLQPMKDWHLNSTFEGGVQVTSRRVQFIRLYALIGGFILLIGCINFMNLNTAQFQKRGKEVGVRKAIGSMRGEVAGQFLMESFLYSFAALLISLILAYALLPIFNDFSGKDIRFLWMNPWFWMISLGFSTLVALLAGGYPAVILSSFNPIQALKGKLRQGRTSVRMRQGLVVFQFTISIVLMISTFTVHEQIQFAKERSVGYEREGLITMRGRGSAFAQNAELLRAELIQSGVVQEVGMSNYPLTNTLGNNDGFRLEGTDRDVPASFNTVHISPEYGQAVELEFVYGRDFSREFGDETGSVIISESAARLLGVQNPVGQMLLSSRNLYDKSGFEIIGVIKDLVKGSPFDEPMPLILFQTPNYQWYGHFFIRLAPGVSFGNAIPTIENIVRQVNPDVPFEYNFADDQYLTKFRAEEQVGSLATLFSVLAILISCLGLFGLSAFMVAQRVKEIGIRKVMGASIASLWALLSKDFGILVAISCFISAPIGGYFMNSWLQDYQYRISLGWEIYTISILLSILITLATVSYHSLKASRVNPVESLKAE